VPSQISATSSASRRLDPPWKIDALTAGQALGAAALGGLADVSSPTTSFLSAAGLILCSTVAATRQAGLGAAHPCSTCTIVSTRSWVSDGAVGSATASRFWISTLGTEELRSSEDGFEVPCQQHLGGLLGVVHRDDQLGP